MWPAAFFDDSCYNMKDKILPVKQDEWVYTTTKKAARTKAKRARNKAKRALSKKLLQEENLEE